MLDSVVPSLKLCDEMFALNEKEWKKWVHEGEPQNVPFPGDANNLSEWLKCLIIKALRPEKVVFNMKFFIRDKIGEGFAFPPPVKLSDVYKDTDERSPSIFILGKGSDPGDTIKELAKTKGKDTDIITLSLGSGSEEKARKNIQTSNKDGTWVILCNCHLFEDWLPELLKECDAVRDPSNMNVNSEFRLFLTARPCNRFPIPLLQYGIKVAYENPKGLKKNMMGSMLK
jgi:dynein heavy chain